MTVTRIGKRLEAPKIRDLAQDEEEHCVELWRQCGLLVPHNDPYTDIALFRSSSSARIFAAQIDHTLVGTLCAGHDGHRGWLYYLAVIPRERDQGIAGQLLRTAENWLSDQGIRKVQLMIRPGNQTVAAFYEKQGYCLTPRAVMARWLNGQEDPGKDIREKTYIESEITYLEMESPPAFDEEQKRFPPDVHLLEAYDPPLPFYRFLYNSVGAPWLWWERRIMSDSELSAILSDPGLELHVLYSKGVPAGFAELNRHHEGEVELAYFGLMPEFIGQGLGPTLLRFAVEYAWRTDSCSAVPSVLKVNTCNLDHPRALGLYQSVGFRIRSREKKRIIDPRSLGLFPERTA